MGCGSSGQVVPNHEEANGAAKSGNGATTTDNNHHDRNHDSDDLPTLVLPESPIVPKPPVAFEIPLEEFDVPRRASVTPPPRVQRLLQPPHAEISLPHIEEKLAEAEQRRLTILQQRAASAQKRTQKLVRNFQEMDILNAEHEPMEAVNRGRNSLTTTQLPESGMREDNKISPYGEPIEAAKHGANSLAIPPEPGVHGDKNIS